MASYFNSNLFPSGSTVYANLSLHKYTAEK